MKDYDVIIIGTGIGGLACGASLVSKGLKVLMLEKNPTPGGYLTSFKRKGFVFDSAVYCFSGLDEDGAITHLLKQLDVEHEISFLRLDPMAESIFPGMRVPTCGNLTEYRESLKKLFPNEKGVDGLFDKLEEIYHDIIRWANGLIQEKEFAQPFSAAYLQYSGFTFKNVLDKYLHDERLKSIISDRVSFLGLPPSKVSAVNTVIAVMSYFVSGSYRPIGGCQRLSDVLANGIEKKGGRILYKSAVSKILEQGNKAVGVKTADGKEFTADFVVSNMDYLKTFSMVGNGAHAASSLERLREYGLSTSFFILYIGTGKGFDVSDMSGNVCWYSSFDMEPPFDPKNAFTDAGLMGVSIPTLQDKSMAPEGCHSLVVHQVTDYGYTDSWKRDKERLCDRAMNQLEKVMPGIKNAALHVEGATPATLERYTSNTNGAAYGWQQIPQLRTIKTGVENLYLAGHWDGLGGGVIAATYSGLKTAKEILRKAV